MEIQALTELHYPDLKRIYMEGIATGHATFETEAPLWGKWDTDHTQHSRFVAVENAEVLGWAALSMVSGRCVYSGVAEVSVYIGLAHRGKGVGNRLMQELILSSEINQIWTLQAGIFPKNEASLSLHQRNGFKQFGRRERIGKMNNLWRDTILLERRSKIVGTN